MSCVKVVEVMVGMHHEHPGWRKPCAYGLTTTAPVLGWGTMPLQEGMSANTNNVQ